MPRKKKTHYEILGVTATATKEAITKAFHALALKHHPDRHKDNKKKAEERFKKISQAYDVVSDPGRRRKYDASLLQREIPRPRKRPEAQDPRPQSRPRQRRREERRAAPSSFRADGSGFNVGTYGVYSKTRPADPHMRTGDVYSKTSKPPPAGCDCPQCIPH